MRQALLSVKSQHIIRLERGEDVFPMLTNFCERDGIESAVFSALGAVEKIKLGYYDLVTKQYGSKEYFDAHEVASMTGNVALVDPIREPSASNGAGGKPFIHMHAVFSGIAPGTENQCVGGHVFAATVAVTLEVRLTVFNEPLTRTLDKEIGLKLLDCNVVQ